MDPNTSPAGVVTLDRDVQRAADAARSHGLIRPGRSHRLDAFREDRTDDQIGRAAAGMLAAGGVAPSPGTAFVPSAGIRLAFDTAMREYAALALRTSALSIGGNFPDRDGPVTDVYFNGSDEPADMTWAQIFDVRDFRQTTEEDFEVMDIANAVTFRVYADGERIELVGVSASLAKFPFALVAGGFQFSWTWIQDSKFWRVADGIRSAMTNYADNMARLAWAVVTNAAGLVTATRDATGTSVVARDIRTVNNAATAILAGMRAAGNVVPTNPSFVLAYNSLTPGLAERAAAMQAANYGLANAELGGIALGQPTTPVASPHVPTGGFFLILPKRKTKTGLRMDLTMFEKFEPTNLSEARVGAGRYTHVRGDANQVRFIPLI